MKPCLRTRRDVLKAAGLGVATGLVRGKVAVAASRKPRPNVLLITSEDNGPHLGCYGDPYARTPNLDKLAAGGVRFTHAYVTNPVCSPSRGSIFTGLYPHQNGQRGLATHKYAMFRKWPNLVSVLKAAGYRTGIIGKIHVNPENAFPCDFRAFPGSNFNKRPVRKFAAEAGTFIQSGEGPFFLMVNFPDAHFPLLRQDGGLPAEPQTAGEVKTLPFVGADSERLRGFTANYYNCLSRLDTGVGLLLDALERAGVADNTLVIYLGDHGAQFSRGKTTLYEGGVHVPFLVRRPGKATAGLVREELVSSIDILPTVLAATGAPVPRDLPGRSLLPLCERGQVAWREVVFTENDGATPFWTFPTRTVRDRRYKLHVSLLRDRPHPTYAYYAEQKLAFFKAGTNARELAAAPEHVRQAYATWRDPPPVALYDLRKDPYEWHNLAGRPEYADVQARLMKAMADWQHRTADPMADPAKRKRYVAEMDGVMERKVNYRRQKGFRWQYLDDLAPTGP